MKFSFPDGASDFEIPDEWWLESVSKSSGMNLKHFKFQERPGAFVIPIKEIQAPKRDDDFPMFPDSERLKKILKAMRTSAALPPVMIWSKEKSRTDKFMVRDGFHRYHLSVALGFKELPVFVEDFDVFNTFPDV